MPGSVLEPFPKKTPDHLPELSAAQPPGRARRNYATANLRPPWANRIPPTAPRLRQRRQRCPQRYLTGHLKHMRDGRRRSGTDLDPDPTADPTADPARKRTLHIPHPKGESGTDSLLDTAPAQVDRVPGRCRPLHCLYAAVPSGHLATTCLLRPSDREYSVQALSPLRRSVAGSLPAACRSRPPPRAGTPLPLQTSSVKRNSLLVSLSFAPRGSDSYPLRSGFGSDADPNRPGAGFRRRRHSRPYRHSERSVLLYVLRRRIPPSPGPHRVVSPRHREAHSDATSSTVARAAQNTPAQPSARPRAAGSPGNHCDAARST